MGNIRRNLSILYVCLLASAAGAEERQPYLPSPVRIAGEQPVEFRHVAESATCGQAGCHPDIHAQWESSAHHFSSFNNRFYAKAVELLMQEENGVERAQWCAGCHDPALLLTDGFRPDLDPEGELANAGIGCLICHAAEEPVDLRGNGGYRIRAVDSIPFGDSESAFLRKLGRGLLRARPAKHAKMLLRPLHKRAEFCMSCHKVSVPPEVNGYRWKRGQNEYDSWHHSGVSGNNAASFYFRRNPATCIDCHMMEVESEDEGNDEGLVADHRFPAANSALPFLRGDERQLRAVEERMQRGTLRISLTAIEDEDGRLLSPDELTGEHEGPLMLYVGVRNLDVGHAFPGGTTDSHEAWIHFRATDAGGRVLLESGSLLEDGSVDPDSRIYRTRLVDSEGRLLEKRNVQHWVATAYSSKIAPGMTDIARYMLRSDAEVQWPVSVTARVRYRKFHPRFTRWVFHGSHEEGEIPELPIVDIATTRRLLGGEPEPRADDRTLASEWNDLGIALFVQKDRVRSESCFRRAAELDPGRADLQWNQARIALADGDLSLAAEHLDRAEALDPTHPTLRLLRARVDAAHGRQEAAVAGYRALLTELPLDRGVWAELAETLYFAGEYESALECYERVLEIDPESLAGFNGRLICLRALGLPSDQALAAVEYYKAKESEASIAGRWLRGHPLENRSSRPVWRFDPGEEAP